MMKRMRKRMVIRVSARRKKMEKEQDKRKMNKMTKTMRI